MSGSICGVTGACVLGSVLVGTFGPQASGAVNLEWRPAVHTVGVGQTAEVGLYAVSDDDSDQSISALDVILAWDALPLGLLGKEDDGPYTWQVSAFPDNSAFDGLNDTWLDGDAYYLAWAQSGAPAYATPEGLLVTTFQFEALEVGEASITIPPDAGHFTHTRVWSGDEPGTEVTGVLGSAAIDIRPCGDADYDSDEDVDLEDFAAFQSCFTGEGATAETICQCVFDTGGDQDVDLSDFAAFWLVFGGPFQASCQTGPSAPALD